MAARAGGSDQVLVAVGGWGDGYQRLNTVDCLRLDPSAPCSGDTTTPGWRPLPAGDPGLATAPGWRPLPPMRVGRVGPAVAVTASGAIFVAGGAGDGAGAGSAELCGCCLAPIVRHRVTCRRAHLTDQLLLPTYLGRRYEPWGASAAEMAAVRVLPLSDTTLAADLATVRAGAPRRGGWAVEGAGADAAGRAWRGSSLPARRRARAGDGWLGQSKPHHSGHSRGLGTVIIVVDVRWWCWRQ
jgi:hypothetical protein